MAISMEWRRTGHWKSGTSSAGLYNSGGHRVEVPSTQTSSQLHRKSDRQIASASVVWWEEKKECFVTSVDTIYLLESLVAVRFTVEEKNRIRRNLEGFRPLTVSKAKSDSEDFFKIIMGFPNPKPRNIEKDVKVFPWKILAHALKKIIGKYVGSLSSTLKSYTNSRAVRELLFHRRCSSHTSKFYLRQRRSI